MKTKPNRCECPDRAFDHSPQDCKGVPVYLIRRKDAELWVCESCNRSKDVYVFGGKSHEKL